MVGSGFYGYGTDWYTSYYMQNIDRGFWLKDKIGWKIVTLSIFDFHIGAYITTFLLSYSSGLLTLSFFKKKELDTKKYFFLILIIIFHTYPIIMSTTNAMRQGLAMSFMFLFLYSYLEKKKILAFLYLIIGFFMHRSVGPLYFYIYFLMIYFLFLGKFFSNKILLLIVYFLSCVFISTILLVHMGIDSGFDVETRIISNDFRIAYLMINLGLIFMLTYNYQSLFNNAVNIYIYIFSFIVIVPLILGYNWEYERLCMTMLIPYILVFGNLFPKYYSIFLWFSLFIILLILTIYTGMYESLT
jgi:hypothetical protein